MGRSLRSAARVRGAQLTRVGCCRWRSTTTSSPTTKPKPEAATAANTDSFATIYATASVRSCAPSNVDAARRRRGARTRRCAWHDDGFSVVGIDLAHGNTRRIVDHTTAAVTASLYDLPFPNDQFDALWTMSTFVHVPHNRFDDAIGEMFRVVAPGAPVAIGTWGGLDFEGVAEFGELRPYGSFHLQTMTAGSTCSNNRATSKCSRPSTRTTTMGGSTSSPSCARLREISDVPVDRPLTSPGADEPLRYVGTTWFVSAGPVASLPAGWPVLLALQLLGGFGVLVELQKVADLLRKHP